MACPLWVQRIVSGARAPPSIQRMTAVFARPTFVRWSLAGAPSTRETPTTARPRGEGVGWASGGRHDAPERFQHVLRLTGWELHERHVLACEQRWWREDARGKHERGQAACASRGKPLDQAVQEELVGRIVPIYVAQHERPRIGWLGQTTLQSLIERCSYKRVVISQPERPGHALGACLVGIDQQDPFGWVVLSSALRHLFYPAARFPQ